VCVFYADAPVTRFALVMSIVKSNPQGATLPEEQHWIATFDE